MLVEKKSPRVVGRQVYGNLYGCDPQLLSDLGYLERVVRKAAEVGGMKLLDVKAWKIGLGVSIVGIILESHISIHTWPEYSFATVDVYSCGEHTDPEKAFEYIVSALKASKVEKGFADRSLI
ncbi:MAG: adenosylmethionine decarboxylase [Sulfolobales archaeon]